jgi:hypothetical protein
MVSWLTAGDTSVTRGGIIVLRGGACAVERAADPVCWMLDNGRASAALFSAGQNSPCFGCALGNVQGWIFCENHALLGGQDSAIGSG